MNPQYIRQLRFFIFFQHQLTISTNEVALSVYLDRNVAIGTDSFKENKVHSHGRNCPKTQFVLLSNKKICMTLTIFLIKI